jgi:hypothetical protein
VAKPLYNNNNNIVGRKYIKKFCEPHEQGNIVGREYIHFVKNAGNPSFLMPF